MADNTTLETRASDPLPQGMPPEQEKTIFVASQRQLIWWKFRRHKLALFSGVLVILIYLVALFAEFLAPFPSDQYAVKYTYAPPQGLHLFERTQEGFRFNPHVVGYISKLDAVALRRTFEIDESQIIPIRFFVKGEPYKLFWLIPATVRLVGPVDKTQPMYIFGADRLGRDVLSRVIYGTRISMSIGLVGVAISLVLGVLLGGISGYYGGPIDIVVQRVIEFIRSIPTIPLWLGLSAALPKNWSPVQIYFSITFILSFISWTGMARVVRGRFLSLREEEFVLAAKLDGSSEFRLILIHMVPSFLSHIIASITLSIPHMILAETSLSFLGLGLRAPAVSWGVLLQEAQNVRAVITAPWLLIPALAVITTVLVLNFLGDGLRDAADPYAQ
jgi:peptide/nickel transport system permease protein